MEEKSDLFLFIFIEIVFTASAIGSSQSLNLVRSQKLYREESSTVWYLSLIILLEIYSKIPILRSNF